MPPRPRTETIRFLTLDELGRLLAATRDSVRDRALFLLAYRHGLRASEVGLLRGEDLDLRALRLVGHRLKGSLSGPHPLRPDEEGAPGVAARGGAAAVPRAVPQQPRRPDRPPHLGLADEEVR